MKLIYGDLFQEPTGVIAHGVNCQGAMGSGVAKIVRDNFPEVYDQYRRYWRTANNEGRTLLGECQIVEINDQLAIANCFTQDYFGQSGGPYATLDAIRESLTIAAEWATLEGMTLKMPKIGAGLGGLQWDDVAMVVSEVEYNSKIEDIHVYYI